jgi:hypothetical protein
VIGTDYCSACESVMPFVLGRRPASPAELVGTILEGHTEVTAVAWTCRACGKPGEGAMERLIVHLAALGLDPQPADAATLAGLVKVTFGRYVDRESGVGLTIAQIWKKDPNYVRWLASDWNRDRRVNSAAQAWLRVHAKGVA